VSPDDRKGDSDSSDFGWRIHALVDNWTGKVDGKASITLAIESAAFAFVVTQTQKGGEFENLGGTSEWWFRAGLALLLLAAALALLVVMPQLNRRKSGQEWESNTIYFGHLRHWRSDDLAKSLVEDQTHPDQLARQLVAMSKIAWRKHAWLQASLVLLAAAVAILVLVAITS
jgi:membrane protein YdbS with pleckstrin-like domain